MRVIAGKYRSRRLKSLRGAALRPTSDRLRETLFNILGPTVEGCVFVDLYAGTGAVGIEALSRGAARVLFIEKHPPAVALIRANLSALGIPAGPAPAETERALAFSGQRDARAEIVAADAIRGLQLLAARRVRADYIFLDPPYADREAYQGTLEVLGELAGRSGLAPSGRVIVEHARRLELPDHMGDLERARVVTQGDAALSFYRLALAA